MQLVTAVTARRTADTAGTQDSTPTLGFAEDGARIGRFVGHKGSVNTCDWTCEFRPLSAEPGCCVRLHRGGLDRGPGTVQGTPAP